MNKTHKPYEDDLRRIARQDGITHISTNVLKPIKRVIASYINNDDVIGMFIIGSAASNSMDKYSDIDLLCVVTSSFGDSSRESFIDPTSGIPFEVLFNTTAELLQYLKEEESSVNRTTAHMISTGEVLFNKDGQLNTLIIKAKQVIAANTATTDNQSTMIRYSIEDFLSDAKREFEERNKVTFMMYSEKLINNVIEASLRNNNGYFRPPRQLMDFIKVCDFPLANLLQDFYSDNNKDKLKTLESIANHGLQLLGGRLPIRWNINKELHS